MELHCFYLTKTRICWQVQAKTRHGWKSVAIEQNGWVTKNWRNNGWKKNKKKTSMSLVGKSSKFCDSRCSQWVVIIGVHGFYRSRFRTHVNHILWLMIYLKNQGPQNDIFFDHLWDIDLPPFRVRSGSHRWWKSHRSHRPQGITMNFITETQGKFFISHCFEAQTLQIRGGPRVFTSATGRVGSQIEKKVRKIELSEFWKNCLTWSLNLPIAHPSPSQWHSAAKFTLMSWEFCAGYRWDPRFYEYSVNIYYIDNHRYISCVHI